jgi:hypothetical protein
MQSRSLLLLLAVVTLFGAPYGALMPAFAQCITQTAPQVRRIQFEVAQNILDLILLESQGLTRRRVNLICLHGHFFQTADPDQDVLRFNELRACRRRFLGRQLPS